MPTPSKRAEEVAQLREQAMATLVLLGQLIERQPAEIHLGTWRALRNTVQRAWLDVSDYIEREEQRRASKGGAS